MEQHAQAVIELHHADTEGSGDTENRTDHRGDMTLWPIGPLIFFPKIG